ncbi:hypothetical protein, partial [Pseudomonas syringae]|uniref:hypothetical protein n=1 Tax=Pseudomonas syringae TaxID=317 RepID=UPI0034D96919
LWQARHLQADLSHQVNGVSSDTLVRLAGVVSRSSAAWLGCVSEDARLSTFTSVQELQRCDKTVTTNWGGKRGNKTKIKKR